MRILGVDPGPEVSGAALVDGDKWPPRIIRAWPKEPNTNLEDWIRHNTFRQLAIEFPAARGMPTANEEFETAAQAGRFECCAGCRVSCLGRVTRQEVKMAICGRSAARDTNIRQALIDMYPRTGGGKTPQIGTKAKPGPLYGVANHAWSALAVAVAWLRREGVAR